MGSKKRSGTGASEAKRPPLLGSLGWLEPHIMERETTSNWQSTSDIIEDDEDDHEEEEEQEDIDNISLVSGASNTSAVFSNTNSSKQAKETNSNVSSITGRKQFQKNGNKGKGEANIEY